MSTEPTRRGRAATGKRGTFTFRVTSWIRDQLTEAAARNTRPVSEEVEDRIARSFDTEPLLRALRIDGPTGEYVTQLARVIDSVQRHGERFNYTEKMMREALRGAADTLSEIYFWTPEVGDVRKACTSDYLDLNDPTDLGRSTAFQEIAFEFVDSVEELNITPLSPRWSSGPEGQGPRFNSNSDIGANTQHPAG